MPQALFGKDWIDAEIDYSVEEYEALIERALRMKRGEVPSADTILKGRVVHLLFFNRSLRTQTSIKAGVAQLGGTTNLLDVESIYAPVLPGDDVAYTTERISDVARVLSSMGDAIAIRMYGGRTGWVYGKANAILKEFARWSKVPVISMECDKYHPMQSLADVMTMREHSGALAGKKLALTWAYSGSYQKPVAVPQSLALLATKMGMNVALAHPKGFELDPEVIERCRRFAAERGGSLTFSHDMREAFDDADFVYPKSWGALQHFADPTLGRAANLEAMAELFKANRGWICTEELLRRSKPGVKYMHCLPCDRGQEVTDAVIDGPASIVFDQAENRLHVQKAVVSALLASAS